MTATARPSFGRPRGSCRKVLTPGTTALDGTPITPLYLIYQQQSGFSQITLTLIYAAYAIGSIAALLLFRTAGTGSAKSVSDRRQGRL